MHPRRRSRAEFGLVLTLTPNPNSFMNTIRVSNSLVPDQAQLNVGPDLGPNSLQRLSADDTCRQRVNDQRPV